MRVGRRDGVAVVMPDDLFLALCWTAAVFGGFGLLGVVGWAVWR